MNKETASPKKKVGQRELAYERVLAAIIYGDLEPGSVVDEKSLSKQFGLGLASVRDTLARLSLEGLVERQSRVGTRIAWLGLRELQEVFELRVMFESNTAGLAAERATADDVAEMYAALEGYEGVIERGEFRQLVRMDQAFHRAMAAATKNHQLEQQMTRLHNSASRFWYFCLSRMDRETIRSDIELHMKVVEAIEQRDSSAAAAAMRVVLGHFPQSVQQFFTTPMFMQKGELQR